MLNIMVLFARVNIICYVCETKQTIYIMKTTYNKSKIMKEAHRLMKYEGLNRSQALKLAWSTAKRNSFYQIEVRNECNNIAFDIAMLGNTLRNYYANYAYNGD